MNDSTLFDVRSELWSRAFSVAQSYEQYLASGTERQQAKWRSHRDAVVLSEQQRELLASFNRSMRVLVVSGIWCGDCARQCPILAAIADVSGALDVRFIDNQTIPELRDELRIHGASRVPVVVTLSEDFFEVGRSGDRTLSVYRRKYHNEVGAACDVGLITPALELSEWVDHFERQQLLLRVSPFLRARHGD
jgi:thiol-disulfide isomerase/thioredoxin